MFNRLFSYKTTVFRQLVKILEAVLNTNNIHRDLGNHVLNIENI